MVESDDLRREQVLEEIAEVLAPYTADESDVDWCDEAAAALLVAFPGLVATPTPALPEGMTATRLREIAFEVGEFTGWDPDNDPTAVILRELYAWADALPASREEETP